MTKLPKHFDMTPTLIHADIHLTIDGGDIRSDVMQEAFEAMGRAFEEVTERHKLNSCLSRKLRSANPIVMRKALRKKGFQVPFESVAVPQAHD